MRTRSGLRARFGSCAVFLASIPWARASSADLRESVERVTQRWRTAGATVVVQTPRFLNEDQTISVALQDLPDAPCTTILALGARGLGFHVIVDTPDDDHTRMRMPSEAGALTIERCGQPSPRRLAVAADSGRGALEIVVARSPQGLPALSTILPERTEGQFGAWQDPGPMPIVSAPEGRADLFEERARRDGAAIARRLKWTAGFDGMGTGQEILAPGCHQLVLFAPDARAPSRAHGGNLDLDAELRNASDDHLMARDRTAAPDATLSTCVAETTQVIVAFGGAQGHVPVLVSHVWRALPQHLPTVWGSEAEARIAQVVLSRHLTSLSREPVALAGGGAGAVGVPFAIEPGACYVAVMTLLQGAAHAVGLRVQVGPRTAIDVHGNEPPGAVVAFCSEDQLHAVAQVETHGAPPLGWGLAVYHVEDEAWGVAR